MLLFVVSLLLVPLVQIMASGVTAGRSSPASVATVAPRPTPTFGSYADYVNRGRALWREHKYEEAVRDLEVAKRLSATDPTAYNLCALAKVPLRRYDEALADVDVALEKATTANAKVSYLDTRAYVLLSSGSCQEASLDYEASMSQRSTPPAAQLPGPPPELPVSG